jgi:hypothetical protein
MKLFSSVYVEGKNEKSLLKKLKILGTTIVTEAIAEKLIGLHITFGSTSSNSPIEGPKLLSIIDEDTRGKEKKQDPTDWDWMEHFDWDGDMKLFEKSKTIAFNPITAVLGN